jgi:hypothetical protein
MKYWFALVGQTQWDARNASGSRVSRRCVKRVHIVFIVQRSRAVDLCILGGLAFFRSPGHRKEKTLRPEVSMVVRT